MSRWADLFAELSCDTVDTMRHSAGAGFIVSQSVQNVPAPGEPAPTFDPALGSGASEPSTSSPGEPVGADGATEAAPSAASNDPTFWRDLHAGRTAIRQYDGSYTRDQGEHLAWGELQNRWHMEHGERVPRQLCAGCWRPIGNQALELIDGCRVHSDGYDCLIRWGERWRGAATRALVEMGLRPPTSGDA